METTKLAVVGSLKFHFFQVKSPKTHHQNRLPTITCGLRGGPRRPMWRNKRISNEAIQAIQSLKLAKSSSSSRIQDVLNSKFARLLKADLLDTLEVLQKQNELDLVLLVFEFLRKDVTYMPDISLYYGMIQMLGKNKLVGMAEELFSEMEKEGLKPDTRAFTEMIGVYLQVGMIEEAIGMYGRMKSSGCPPDKLTFTILIRNLKDAGRDEIADAVRKDCGDFMDYPEKFLKEVDCMHTKRPSLDLL